MVASNQARPAFGGRLKTAEYYAGINSIISVMRGVATMRTMANHLTAAGFLTPTDLPWNRARLNNYLRQMAN